MEKERLERDGSAPAEGRMRRRGGRGEEQERSELREGEMRVVWGRARSAQSASLKRRRVKTQRDVSETKRRVRGVERERKKKKAAILRGNSEAKYVYMVMNCAVMEDD